MLPLDQLLPGDLLQRSSQRSRFTFETEPTAWISVLFQTSATATRQDITDHQARPPLSTALWAAAGADRGRYGLTYVLAGHMTIDLDGEPRSAGPGSLIHFGVRGPLVLGTDPGFLECSVCVDPASGQRLIEDGLWDDRWTLAEAGESAGLLLAYHDLYRAICDETADHLALRVRLLRVFETAEAARRACDPQATFLARAASLLDAHPEPSYGIAQAARELGLTPTTFARRFTAATGLSPARWHQRRRLEQAAALLASHRVSEVARRMGYTDAALFSRQFRRLMGVPPSALAPRG